MRMYLIASFVKIITKGIFAVYQLKSVRMVSYWDLYVCSWAMIYAYTAAAEIDIKHIQW